jgi:hypothetical protein
VQPPSCLTHASVLALGAFLSSCSTPVRSGSDPRPDALTRLEPSPEEVRPLPAPSDAHDPALALYAVDLPISEPAMAPLPSLPPLQDRRRSRDTEWGPGQALLQGFLGATLYQEVERSGGGPTVEDDDLLEVPAIGGGGQWKIFGEGVDVGMEGMLAFSWRANATAFAVGSGGVAVAVDVDLLLFDLYGGPFVNVFLGDHVRLYAAAGPLMQWGQYEQTGPSLDGNGSGFGVGLYARTGIEMLVGAGTWLGFGVRWSDSKLDLDDNQGELDLNGFQIAFTVSRFN